MNIIRATPVASFAILALLFLSGPGFSIFIAFLMVLPLVWSNVHEGLTHLDPQLLEMARVFRLPRSAILKQIIFPSTLPYLLSAVRVGLGFCWKAGVAGEVIAIPANAIGTQLYNAKIYLETGDLFAWTAVIILLSMALEQCAVWLLDRERSGSIYRRREKGAEAAKCFLLLSEYAGTPTVVPEPGLRGQDCHYGTLRQRKNHPSPPDGRAVYSPGGNGGRGPRPRGWRWFFRKTGCCHG